MTLQRHAVGAKGIGPRPHPPIGQELTIAVHTNRAGHRLAAIKKPQYPQSDPTYTLQIAARHKPNHKTDQFLHLVAKIVHSPQSTVHSTCFFALPWTVDCRPWTISDKIASQ